MIMLMGKLGGRLPEVGFALSLLATVLVTPTMAATQLSAPDQQLYDAIDAGNAAGVTQALSQGANIEVKDMFHHSGMTPLLRAFTLEKYDIVKLLLEDHANVDATVPGGATMLWVAAATGNVAMVTLFLEHHANTEAKGGLNGETPLGEAAGDGYTDIVKLLLAHHANTAATDNAGNTPMQMASLGRRTDIVSLLAGNQSQDDNLTAQQAQLTAKPTQYVCSNTDNGYRTSIVTLDKEHASVHVQDSDETSDFAAEFKPDNTVFWIHNVNQGVVSATVRFTLNISEKVLHTVEHAEALGQSQTSEMLWSCAEHKAP
jgi:hypothetical protein